MKYDNSFNASAITGTSMYVTFPFFSNFGDSSKKYASQMTQNSQNVTYSHSQDTKINIELYSGLALSSLQSYQVNYVFDGDASGLDEATFFAPSYIYSINLSINEGFAISYFDSI